MAIEIERKYLIKNNDWRLKSDKGTTLKQGYLSVVPERTVRVRIKDIQGFLTIKGKTKNASRLEFEYPIPLNDALELLELCQQPIVEKKRYLVKADELTWEIDIFEGVNKGLMIAEVELESEDQTVILPDWIGEEVTQDTRYYNSNLIAHPFSEWDK